MPRFGYSFAVSTDPFVKTVTFTDVRPTQLSGDLGAQMRSALENLDNMLGQRGLSRFFVLRINVTFAGLTYRDTVTVGDALNEYFATRQRFVEGVPGANGDPVRTTVGVQALDPPDLKVTLNALVVDHNATLSEAVANREARTREGLGQKTVLFGGVTAQQKDFTVEGFNNPQREITGAIRNMRNVLATAGGELSDVTSLTVYYVERGNRPEAPVRTNMEQEVRTALLGSGFTDQNLPRLEFKAVGVACTPSFQYVIDGEAKVTR
jgi:enamine deaminase RidA (YjgF/YER057c/UK114 family)